jgi:hypothetical protein
VCIFIMLFYVHRMFEEAARIAYEQKDLQALLFVQGRCVSADRNLSDKINLLVNQLSSKK